MLSVLLLTRRSYQRRSMESVLALKYNDGFRWFGFVDRQTGHRRIAPVGKVYYRPSWCARKGIISRLDDVQPVIVEKERVVAKQFVQVRNHRMVVGDHPGIELGQSLLDLSGIQFHNALHSLAFGESQVVMAEAQLAIAESRRKLTTSARSYFKVRTDNDRPTAGGHYRRYTTRCMPMQSRCNGLFA